MSYNKETGMYEGYIYCIINLINGKKYIGQTTRTPELRWKQHITTSKNINARKYPIHLAINKYGEENFTINTVRKYITSNLEELTTMLNVDEIFFIEKNNLTDKKLGYNLSIGGGILQLPHKKVKQFSTSGDLIKIWNSIKEACDFYETSYSNIIGVCTGFSKTSKGFVWRYQDDDFSKFDCTNRNEKKIVKYDLSGNFIAEYNSITEAAHFNNANITHIFHCCIGKNKTCKGFVFRYKGDCFDKYDIKNKTQNKDYVWATSKKINCYTLENVYVKTYNSLHEAQIEVGLKSSSSITAACKGQIKYSAGYKWYYANDSKQPDKTKIIN